jgi:hypothetical protein
MFPGREAAIWAAATNRRRLPARIEILALPFASSNGIGACVAVGPVRLFHISSPNYTPFAPEPESPRVTGAEVSRGIPFLGPHPGVVAISVFMALLSFIDPPEPRSC